MISTFDFSHSNGFLFDRCSLATGVSVWKRGKSRGVNNAFVEDESVAFGACDDP